MGNYTLISREEAAKINQKWFFTGIPCKNGHIDKRYVNTGICYECKRNLNKVHYDRYPEVIAAINSKSYYKHPEKRKQNSQTWAENNREKSNSIKRKYRQTHKELVNASSREYQNNCRKDPFVRLSKNLSKSIWECLKECKNNQRWLQFVTFTFPELTRHLEKQFIDGMTWDNYGSYWHIDHVKPLSWFNLETEFKLAWALENLQPLKAFENLSKNNRYEGKYKSISQKNISG